MSTDSDCVPVVNVRTCLSNGQSLGLALVVEAGLISATALAILFLLIIRNIYRYVKYAGNSRWSLVQEPADVFMLSLFTADCLQAIGGIMSVRWVQQGYVQTGLFCSIQGAMQQIGNTGAALGTMTIAIHTFIAIWFRIGLHNILAAVITVACVWTFLILWVAIGWARFGGTKYFTPTPYWCWVGSNYLKERIAGDYAWLWLTLVVSLVVYVLLFLWSRGYVRVDPDCWWRVQIRKRPKRNLDAESELTMNRGSTASDMSASARTKGTPTLALLAYPIIHSMMILPLSVVRWLSFSGAFKSVNGLPGQPPLAATFSVEFVYGLFGFANTLLLTTRRNLLLFEDPIVHRDRQASGYSGRSYTTRSGRGGRAPSPAPSRETVDTHTSLNDLSDNGRTKTSPSSVPTSIYGL